MTINDTIEINTGIEPDFLQNILTKDISTLDALYDLVDNSIDAARNSILQKGCYGKDTMGLPNSYNGYQVHIDISSESISIEDNCFGMDKPTLIDNAFFIAKPSQHLFGIGQYGIGLKRSLLKMGDQYHFFMDNGIKSYEAQFNKNIFNGTSQTITAIESETQGNIKTKFTVTEIHSEIQGEIENKRWLQNALKGFQDRYSIYFAKGFKITVSYEGKLLGEITSYIPGFRTDGVYLPTRIEENIDGVKVIIESGIHEKYVFKKEDNHSSRENGKLSNDFGIYFICNDRVIVKASTSNNHGWRTKWHTEYNGFVCIVRFISEEPSKLPWNTAKNGMREDSPLFLTVIDKIQPIADKYRSEIKKRYPKKPNPTHTGSTSSSESNQNLPDSANSLDQTDPNTPDDSNNNGKPIHNPKNLKKLVTYNLSIPRDQGKIRQVYLELKNELKVHDTPYATAALLRSLIELSCDYYILKKFPKGGLVFHDKNKTEQVTETASLRIKILGVATDINRHSSDAINNKQLDTLQLACPKRSEGVGSLDILHSVLHNYAHQITSQQVIAAHNNFSPLIKAIWHAQI